MNKVSNGAKIRNRYNQVTVEGVRMTLLVLNNVTMSHRGLEQLSGSLSSCSDQEELFFDAVICNE